MQTNIYIYIYINGREEIGTLKVLDQVICDDMEKANVFEDFFSSVYVAKQGSSDILTFDGSSRCPELVTTEN